ncbi:hypothetical protein [Senegalimassilia faecalis]|uniref:hypothetical protein n=1 Tax=Senegalimassilia faecalis TaxID=2509433 RepID=UPI0030779C58
MLNYTGIMKRPADISKRTVLAIAAALAAAFALLLCAMQASSALPTSEPNPFLSRRSSSNYMIALGPLAAAWGFSAYLRCPDAKIARNLVSVAGLIVLWMLAVLVKFHLDNDLVESLLWYCYYIPMTVIPLLCLDCALRAAALDDKPATRRAMRVFAGITATLIALVLTNNLHHGVFVFDFADASWSGSYRYAPGYYLIVGWQVLLYLAFFATLFLAARMQLKIALVPLAVIAGVGATLSTLYALRIIAMVSLNFSLMYCVLVIAALEIALDVKLFPSYLWYENAFRKLPFDLKILDEESNIVFQTEQACPQTNEAARVVQRSDTLPAESWAFRTTGVAHTLFKVYPVSGGRALFAQDVSDIDARRATLEEQQAQLRRSNSALEREAAVQREAWRLRNERELMADVEDALKDQSLRIKQLVDGLPAENTPHAKTKRNEMLTEAKLLVAYCKRKGALVVSEKSDPEFDRDRLQLVFNETASDLRSIGVDCAAFVQTEHALDACVVSVLYDCLYDLAAAASAADDAVLMLNVHEHEDNAELRAMLTSSAIESAHMVETLAKLRANLAKRNTTHRFEQDGESVCIFVRVPIPRKDVP